MPPTAVLAAALLSAAPAADTQLYELRVYTAQPGKLDALTARFRDAAVPLFAKHGMTFLAAWHPLAPNPDNQFVALLAHKDRSARDAAFKAFAADPAWQQAMADTEKDGKLADKVTEYFLACTDYSPEVKAEAASPPRVFELRLYQSSSDNPQAINARFRDHTTKLFAKHGMTNLWYWNLAAGNKETKHDLIYLLAHPDKSARDRAFDGFRKDPDWQAALKASEAKAGGSLTAKDGVKSVLLTPAEFSPLK
jgi:hypothetical protein